MVELTLARAVVAVMLLTPLGATVTPGQAAGPTMSVLDLPQHSTPGGTTTQSLSRDGRYLLYTRNEGSFSQVELYDRKTRHNQVLSATRSGQLGNGDSRGAVMTPDARYVVFYSLATNLVGTPNPHGGVFFLDRTRKTLRLLNVLSNGREPPGGVAQLLGYGPLDVTADGRAVTFVDFGGYVHGEPASEASAYHYYTVNTVGRPVVRYLVVDALGHPVSADPNQPAALSDDGRHFAFASSNALNAGDPSTYPHVYVYDARTHHAALAATASSPNEIFDDPSVDGRGDLIAYETCTAAFGANLTPTDLSGAGCSVTPLNPSNLKVDVTAGVTGDVWVEQVGHASARDAKAYASALIAAGKPTISRDGSTVYFLGMNQEDIENDQVSVWRWVLKTNTVTRLTGLYCDGSSAPDTNCLTSPDGAYYPACYADEASLCPTDATLLQADSTQLWTDQLGTTVLFRTFGTLSSADRNGAGPSIYLVSGGG